MSVVDSTTVVPAHGAIEPGSVDVIMDTNKVRAMTRTMNREILPPRPIYHPIQG